ncbi:MAG TPA: NAD(P)-dependent oxidoreductase [Solirubrobacteraceae bacterium]|nr:NAD(P)-dependent oxidoreductase [Solirubrobacteraceae bacterium]
MSKRRQALGVLMRLSSSGGSVRRSRDDVHDTMTSEREGRWAMTEGKPRVGLLGVGLMGSAMARRLLDRGVALVAWDRDSEHLQDLRGRGGEVAEGPSDVLSDTSVVITMLPTAEVVLDVVKPLLDDWPDGAVWLQMSSVGAAEADQLTLLAEQHEITLVDAPVSGSTHPAEEGELTILASGPDSARSALEPIFDALASRVLWVGQAGMGSRLKLAANHWMITMVGALAESMHLCNAMGLDQGQFVALLDGGPLGSGYALQKLDEMRRHEYPAGFPVRLALKDMELVREVEQSSHAEMPVLEAVLDRFLAADKELADQDLAAIYELDGQAAV